MANNVIVVDDDAVVRDVLSRCLTEAGYECTAYETAESFLDHRAWEACDLALLDIDLPGRSGMDLLRAIRVRGPRVGCLMVTGESSVDRAVLAMQDGALDYVTKPFALDNVVFRVDRALTRNEGLRREIQHDVDLARLVANRTGQLRAQKAERSSTILAVFGALLGFLEERDPHSKGHSARVARQAVLLGRALGLPAPDIRGLRLAALFHDIGKIGIPDTILRKPGPLTPAEARRMRSHPAIGADALKPIPDSAGVAQAVRHHHEHVNGKGYPDGFVGDEIPLASRIIAVADAVDAMGSARPYRERHSDEYIRAELERQRGQQWDTDVVAALLLGEDWHSSRAQNEQERETWNDTGLSVH